MDDHEKRSDDQGDLSSSVQFKEVAQGQNDEGNDSNPLQVYLTFFAEYSITAEFTLFSSQNIPGIYCLPTASDPYEWFGVLFLRQGIYQGAILRFSLKLPPDFPETEVAPSLTFEVAIFHPDVDIETGALNVKRGFPSWKCGIHHVHQVLVYMQRCFFAIDCTEPVSNSDAANLYKEDMEKYCEKAVESVRRSREVVYDQPHSSDPNAIRFTPWDQSIHEPIRSRILRSVKNSSVQASPGSASSLSWSTSSLNFGPMRSGSGGRSAGLSFFDAKRFGIMAQEKTWTAPAPSSSLINFSDIINGEQNRAQKPTKSSSKSKMFP